LSRVWQKLSDVILDDRLSAQVHPVDRVVDSGQDHENLNQFKYNYLHFSSYI